MKKITIPPIVQRVRDTLNPTNLPKDYRALLDFGKTVRDRWALHLTRGVYNYDGAIRTVEPVRIPINRKDYKELIPYSIFYDARSDSYHIEEGTYTDLVSLMGCLPGHFVGGFVIKECKLSFMLPQDECIRYIRAFSEEFNLGYEVMDEYVDICNKYCSEFNFEYNEEFETTCSYNVYEKLDCTEWYDIYEYFETETPIEKCKIQKSQTKV